MIEIIKRSKFITTRRQFRCKFCGSEWIADKGDYQEKFSGVWVNNIKTYNYYIICPVCGKQNCYPYFDDSNWKDIDSSDTEYKFLGE